MTIKIVVPISGGKDSQACLRLALSEYKKSEILGLFCDTKFEHPETYKHIDKIEKLYGIEIKKINAGNVPDKVLHHKMFPMGGARFCTDQLKIIPSKIFYKELAEEQGGFEVWYGVRAAESNDRKKRYEGKISKELYLPHDVMKNYPKYLGKLGIMFRLPIIDLTYQQVFKILEGEENILYSKGFSRVGCFPCLAAGDYEKLRAFNYDETGRKHFKIVQDIEKIINKSVFKKENDKNSSDLFEGCAICAI